MPLKKVAAIFIFLILSFSLLGAAGQVVSTGKEAPDFTLKDTDGNEVSLKGLRGSPVLLVFWATWCPYCREEIPDLNKLQDDYAKKGLVILGADINESQAKVASFIKQKDVKYRIILDADGQVAELYGVRGIPTNVLIDKNGIITYKNNPLPERAAIEKLL